MSSYASMSIDRRAQYYARSAALIAADPLDFYSRAEKGRRLQASRLNLTKTQSAQVVHFPGSAQVEKLVGIAR